MTQPPRSVPDVLTGIANRMPCGRKRDDEEPQQCNQKRERHAEAGTTAGSATPLEHKIGPRLTPCFHCPIRHSRTQPISHCRICPLVHWSVCPLRALDL